MSALWIVLAFVGGMAFMWKVAGRLLYKALKRSVIFESTLAKMQRCPVCGVHHPSWKRVPLPLLARGIHHVD